MTQNASRVLGTWKLRSYVREVIATGRRHDQFGAKPDGYLGYSPDGRMYAIFTRRDRITPRDVVPTEEEGVQLLGSMVAYAGTYTLGDKQVIHHIDISWNQGWTGTDQVRFFELDGETLTITTAPYRSYLDGREGRSILVWDKVPARDAAGGRRMTDLFGLNGRHALVTGASSGLGRHFAGVLAAAGAQVTVAARRETAAGADRGDHPRIGRAGAERTHGRDGRSQCRAGFRRRRSAVRSGQHPDQQRRRDRNPRRAGHDGQRLVERDRHQPQRQPGWWRSMPRGG